MPVRKLFQLTGKGLTARPREIRMRKVGRFWRNVQNVAITFYDILGCGEEEKERTKGDSHVEQWGWTAGLLTWIGTTQRLLAHCKGTSRR